MCLNLTDLPSIPSPPPFSPSPTTVYHHPQSSSRIPFNMFTHTPSCAHGHFTVSSSELPSPVGAPRILPHAPLQGRRTWRPTLCGVSCPDVLLYRPHHSLQYSMPVVVPQSYCCEEPSRHGCAWARPALKPLGSLCTLFIRLQATLHVHIPPGHAAPHPHPP